MTMMAREEVEPDPTFVLTPEVIMEQGETHGISHESFDAFESAVSLEHMEKIALRIKSEVAEEEFIAGHGLKGTAAVAAASIDDPVVLLLTLLTGGIGTAALRGNRLLRATKVGLLGAAENAGIEAYLASGRATRGAEDVAYAAIGGFLLGGGIGSILSRTDLENFADVATTKATLHAYGEAGGKLSPTAEEFLNGGLIPKYHKPDLADQELARNTIDSHGSVGAAESHLGGAERPLLNEEVDQEFIDDLVTTAPHAWMAWARLDIIGSLLGDKSALTRGYAGIFAEDGVGHKNLDQVQRKTVAETSDLEYRTAATEFYKPYNGAYKKWLESKNYNFVDTLLKCGVWLNKLVGCLILV